MPSLLLPNIRSGWNTGAFFRTADAFGWDHLYLCGHTPYPPHKEISKTALGADEFVPWSYHLSAGKLIAELKAKGVFLCALELTADAIPLDSFTPPPNTPLCLIVGNEIDGVAPEILKECDATVFLPMQGKKESLNVSIAGGIAMWALRN
ncbi:MAG: RNA methyltransferase [Candidatus Peregrinibacteria bacterium]